MVKCTSRVSQEKNENWTVGNEKTRTMMNWTKKQY